MEGGGAGGLTNPGDGSSSGGSGGGAGISASIIITSFFLPNELFLKVGGGGQGGAASTGGTDGGTSFVCNAPNTSAVESLILQSGNAKAKGAAAPSGASFISGGSGETAPTLINNFGGVLTSNLRDFTGGNGSVNGDPGGNAAWVNAAHNSSVNASSITYRKQLTTSGAGGGRGAGGPGSTASGDITGAGLMPTLSGGTVSTPDGQNGFFSFNPWISTGGAGGYGNDSGTGGKGGNAGWGSGGGGGGSGSVAGGRGGDGGPGVIIITWW